MIRLVHLLIICLLTSSPPVVAETLTAKQLESLNYQIKARASIHSVMVEHFPDAVVPRLLRFSNGKRVGYMDLTGKIAIPPVFDGAHNFHHGRVAVRLNGSWGYVDHTGSFIVQPRYEAIAIAWHLPLTAKFNGRWGLLDERGKWIVEPSYEELRFTSEAFEFRKGQKWGVISPSGETLIPATFDGIHSSGTTKYITVRIGNAWRIADRSGKLIGEGQHERIVLYDPDLAVVHRGNQQEMIQIPSGTALPLRHEAIYPTQNRQRWIVKDKGLYGVSDREGNWIIKQAHPQIGTKGISHFEVSNGRLRALASIDGKFLTEFIFEQLREFHDGLAAARISGKWGYIDVGGQIVIEPKFESAFSFVQGLAPVSIDKKHGYIDKAGTFVIPPRFEDAYGFLPDGVATAKLEGQYIYIDRQGRTIAALLRPELPTDETFAPNQGPAR
jgi:WG containing repeat